MHVRRRGTIGFVAGVVVATTLTATTMAIADSRSSTTLHACAAKKGGALRLAGSCKASERAVTWNVRGPRGPRGRTGASGDGPGYRVSQNGSDELPAGSTNVAIAHLDLPPGDYVISAAAAATTTAPADNGSCRLVGAGSQDTAQMAFGIHTGDGANLAFNGLAHATGADPTVSMVCVGQTDVTIAEGQMVAVQVTSSTDQTPTP